MWFQLRFVNKYNIKGKCVPKIYGASFMHVMVWRRKATDYEGSNEYDAKIILFLEVSKYLLLSLEFLAYFKNVLYKVY